MLLYVLLGGLILLLITIGLFFLKGSSDTKGELHPKGYWMGLGIALGLPIGMAVGILLGLVFGDPSFGFALGPAIGIGIGTAIGAALEARKKDQVRPLTEEERQAQRWALLFGFLVLVIGVTVFLLILLDVL